MKGIFPGFIIRFPESAPCRMLYVSVLLFFFILCLQGQSGFLKVETWVAGANQETRLSGCRIFLEEEFEGMTESEYKGITESSGYAIIRGLPLGIQTFRIEKEGYSPKKVKVDVTDVLENVQIYLSRIPNVVITGRVAGTTVFIDGQVKGTTGPDGKLALTLPQGRHRVEFHREGYRSPGASEIIVGGLSQRVSYKMERVVRQNLTHRTCILFS